MRVALDFDNTFTADPKAWRAIIAILHAHDHEVLLVTTRGEHTDGINWDKVGGHIGIEIIWCDGKPKREVAKGIDIWIDDDPYTVVHGSQHTPETLEEWRKQDVYRSPIAESPALGKPTKPSGPRLQRAAHRPKGA